MDICVVILLLLSAFSHTNANSPKLLINEKDSEFPKECEKTSEQPVAGCDCIPRSCNSNCCDASTCKVFKNATCTAGRCCDLKTCQIQTVATICRVPENACDLAEYCDGNTENCPDDVYKSNLETCHNDRLEKLYCFEANCNSTSPSMDKSLQCPSNCSGHGVCNNRGHCHCDVGYDGDRCLQSGPGGSVDSGPATNPLIFLGFPRFAYIVFCAAIPVVVLLNFCVCVFCRKMNCSDCFQEPRKYRPSNASQLPQPRNKVSNEISKDIYENKLQ